MAGPQGQFSTVDLRDPQEQISIYSSPLDTTPSHDDAYDPYANLNHSAKKDRMTEPMISPLSNHSSSRGYDIEKGSRRGFSKLQEDHHDESAHRRKDSSWDLFAGVKKLEQDYNQFDSRNASTSHLAFAEGDMPKNKLSRFYNYLLNVSIVTRWILFIIPVLALLWLPGILGLTAFPNTRIWGVKLLWWSIWLSVAWAGWWAALALSLSLPRIARYTVGIVAVATRRYIDWLAALHRYIAVFLWTLACWIAWQPLIIVRQSPDSSSSSHKIISFIAKLLFGFFLCAAVLLGEKLAIQIIAGKFHERSYADRIADQKKATKILVVLYQHSSDVGRSDALHAGHATKSSLDAAGIFKKAIKGVRGVAQTTTTVFGNLASEIAGSSVLQPNSPQAMVAVALGSANKTRLLARRLFYSFVRPGKESLVPSDISKFFQTHEEADDAFSLFDKDGNGDATRDEVEMACMECHREQLSIANSMKDVDSAVGRLDNIFMSLYTLVAFIIIAVVLDSELTTLLTGAGTLILGLSWLIGGSLTEVLTSIIFLFVKHPFDVGDRVDVGTNSYTVKEIRLLSTIFLDKNNTSVQAPNSILNTQLISNIRRSPTMSETFAFDVAFNTTFEQIEALRDKMLAFVKEERRDFLPSFDVVIVDIPQQTKLSLTADIKYKSNWQQGSLKVRRRNKWICKLKQSLNELKIYGPAGNPDAKPDPKQFTQVPWEEARAKQAEAEQMHLMPEPRPALRRSYQLSDDNAVLLDSSHNVFGEAEQLAMTNPRSMTMPRPQVETHASSSSGPASAGASSSNSRQYAEVIEMSEKIRGGTA